MHSRRGLPSAGCWETVRSGLGTPRERPGHRPESARWHWPRRLQQLRPCAADTIRQTPARPVYEYPTKLRVSYGTQRTAYQEKLAGFLGHDGWVCRHRCWFGKAGTRRLTAASEDPGVFNVMACGLKGMASPTIPMPSRGLSMLPRITPGETSVREASFFFRPAATKFQKPCSSPRPSKSLAMAKPQSMVRHTSCQLH